MQKILPLFLFLVFSSPGYAQTGHLRFDHLNNLNGLPENEVNAIIQDQLGYIWITTQSGMVRYDGYQTQVYHPGSENKLNQPTYLMVTVFQDSHQQVWAVSYDNGLFRYDGRHNHFSQFRSPYLSGHEGTAFATADSAGNVWAIIQTDGTKNTAVEKLDPATDKFSRYAITEKGNRHLLSDSLLYLIVTQQKEVLVGTRQGILKYVAAADGFVPYLPQQVSSLLKKEIPALRSVPDTQRYWFALGQGGMGRYDRQTQKLTRYALANDTVTGLLEDSHRRLWIATAGGLSLYDRVRDQFINYRPAAELPGLASNRLYGLHPDKKGRIWSQTSAEDLLCFDPASGHFIRDVHDKNDPTSVSLAVNNSVLFDRDDQLWLGKSYSGVDHVNQVSSAFRLTSVKAQKIRTAAIGLNGTLLFGSSGGIIRYQKQTGLAKLVSSIKGPCRVFYQAKDGKIYYSNAPVGLMVYDPQTGKKEALVTGPGDPKFSTHLVLQDHLGLVWIASFDQGMFVFDPRSRKLKHFPFIYNNDRLQVSGKLDDSFVESLFEDREGTVWAGTNAGGLNRYDRGRDQFESSFRPEMGLFSVIAISEDALGRIWAGTYLNGVFLVDRASGLPLKQITEKEGLASNDVTIIMAASRDYLSDQRPPRFVTDQFTRSFDPRFLYRRYPLAGPFW